MTDVLAEPDQYLEGCGGTHWISEGGPPEEIAVLSLAQARYRQRRLRDRYFGEELFREPAWDILLDLYIAHSEGKSISVTSMSCAAGVPACTGLRWLAKLERRNLVRRTRAPADGRLVCVEITPEARAKMTELLRRFGAD